jgi:hypothetical protein
MKSAIDNVVITTDDQGGLIGVAAPRPDGNRFDMRNSIRVSKPMASILTIFRDEILRLKKGRVDE